MMPKKDRCRFALLHLLPPEAFSRLSEEALRELGQLVKAAIADVMEDRPNARVSTIARKAMEHYRDEIEELLVQDEDRQAVYKIVEAAIDKFLANSDLGGADAATRDQITGLVRQHMEEVAVDWWLDATTSMDAVIDDLIGEATSRADAEIDAILAGQEDDETEDEEEESDA